MNDAYLDTVRLMLGIAPIIFDTPLFAMKDMPAIRWKLENLRKLRKSSAERFAAQAVLLEQRFDEIDRVRAPV